MKNLVLILCILIPVLSFAQSDSVIIKGRITDCKIKAELVNHKAMVYLVFNNSMQKSIAADSAGYYNFLVSKKLFQTGTVYVYASSGERLEKPIQAAKPAKQDPCEVTGKYEPRGYFQTPYYEVPTASDTAVVDICLTAHLICGPGPAVGFKKNSTEMIVYNGHAADTILQQMYCLMQKHPKMVIGIRAHADRFENMPVKLSAKRGEIIKQKLIAMGIDPARIKIESFGSREWIYDPMPEKPPAEQEEERAVNRRVTFVTISVE